MKRTELVVFIAILTVLTSAFSYAEPLDAQIERQKREAVNAVNLRFETNSNQFSATSPPLTFPYEHPSDAFKGESWSWASQGTEPDLFNIYVWRENGEAWLEIEPISNAPFICSSNFVIIQNNNTQYDTVKLVPLSGGYQCGDVHVTSIFNLGQWSSYTYKADLNQAFTLIFSGVWDTYTLDISTDGGIPDQPDDTVTLSPELNIHIPNLQYKAGSDTMNLWADFIFAGESDGSLIWKLSGFGEK
jgi:hypothetical protein